MAQKVKVQDGIVVYSATDPVQSLNFTIKGSLDVGNDPLVGGTITSDTLQDLNITAGKDLLLNATGSILLNNNVYPGGSVTQGQYLGASAPQTLAYLNFIVATTNSDSLTSTQVDGINAATLAAQPGQYVVGPASVYTCVALPGSPPATRWIRLLGTGGTLTSISGSGGTTGLTLTGGPITTSGTLTLGGTLAIANGGTGQITATNAINALMPSQTGNAGKLLSTDGSQVQWFTPPSGVTSLIAGTGIVVSGPTGTVTISTAAIPNSSLVNNSFTVSAGAGLSVSSPVVLGGALSISLTTAGTPVSSAFVKITTDTFGRLTSTTPVVASDITTLVDSTYVNVTGDTMNSGANLTFADAGEVLGLPAIPTTIGSAASKAYVDSVASGLNIHNACRAGTTTTLAISSAGTVTYNNGVSGVGATLTTTGSYANIGGVVLVNSDRVLVKDQASALQNGIYVRTSSTVLTRATDFDGSPTSEITAGDLTYVQEGSIGGTQWVQLTTGTITVGTTGITWGQFAGSGTYVAGTGINISSNVISALSVPNASLVNSSITIGTTNIALGLSSTTLTGLTSVTSTSLTSSGDITSGSNFLGAIGTAASPTFSFTLDSNTGMYVDSSNANVLRLCVGASDKLIISATTTTVTNSLDVAGRITRSVTAGISAAGATLATATDLISDINVVSTVLANQGVALPTESAGLEIIVINESATSLKVYPSVGTAAIDAAANGVAFTLVAGARIMFICISSTQWYTLNATYA